MPRHIEFYFPIYLLWLLCWRVSIVKDDSTQTSMRQEGQRIDEDNHNKQIQFMEFMCVVWYSISGKEYPSYPFVDREVKLNV